MIFDNSMSIIARQVYYPTLCLLLLSPVVGLAQGGAELRNPLAVNNLTDFLLGILAIVLVAAMPVIIIVLIYSGFLFVTARGNPQTLQQARLMLMYGLIGGVIILGSYTIVAIVQDLVTNF
jgi:hypothetical protein